MLNYEQNRFEHKKESFLINNFGELKSFAKWIASFLDKGSFLSISGDLGVGKTTLVQFLCSELGVKEKVTSPTFTILKRYWLEKRNFFINHFDFFRITVKDNTEIFDDIKDEGINIVEWPERVPLFFSKGKVIRMKISFCQSGRRIEVLHNL